MNVSILNLILQYPVQDIKGWKYKQPREHIVCKDGTTLSVQASEYHYCEPRNNEGPWVSVEVGFPSVAPPDSWAPYFDGNWEQSDPRDGVYAYIPIELVIEFINSHGGV